MDYSWAAPGVWCECIDADWSLNDGMPQTLAALPYTPRVGDKVRILDVLVDARYRGGGALKLDGQPGLLFAVKLFRPLTEMNQDLERMRKLLNPGLVTRFLIQKFERLPWSDEPPLRRPTKVE